ncbi:hypothetical protein FQN53_001418 [Emmonsiellopsis sp. PD_33]|nr:hypothetical protein FQN53_001418 [Emmonsiellopsis sp. PD_33]
MSSQLSPILPEGVGYGVVVGIGFFFAGLMCCISYIQNRYTGYSTKKSEEFNTASRSVKPGLIASGIVSAWTWAATLLQSATVGYQFGISGPFWTDAAGATIQIFMFSVLACKVKQNAPRCHTFLEIIKYRYGTATHVVFIFFGLLCNILVASQLLLSGSAVVNALTGVNVYAAIFLIPLGVCVYVVLGGLRATFLCDYSHTVIIMIIILYFMFSAYATNPLIGSPMTMYELLQKAALVRPVAGNWDGSYVTLKSNSGLVFGVITMCSGLGTVFLDQGYWQRAIASRPTTAVRAYILGGLAWFAIPFGFATTMGLAAVALTDNPSFPTYPEPMSKSQVSSGLAAPFAAAALLGKNGAVAMLITLFMAVTSSSSAELIAVSSIATFDIYKAYIKPEATPNQLIFVSHIMICAFGVLMAGIACIWNVIGIDLGWLYYTMGLLVGGAVFPAAFAVTWKRQSKAGAISGAIGGLVAGLIAWLVETKVLYGAITIYTTGQVYPALAGCLASVFTGMIVSIVVSLMKPDDFDWEATRAINAPVIESVFQGGSGSGSSQASITDTNSKTGYEPKTDETKADEPKTHVTLPVQDEEKETTAETSAEADPKSLQGALKVAWISATVLTLCMDIIVPLPLFFSHYIFSKGFFTAWITISFLWVFCAVGICVVLPVVETAGFFKQLFAEVWKEVRGRRGEETVVDQ